MHVIKFNVARWLRPDGPDGEEARNPVTGMSHCVATKCTKYPWKARANVAT